MPEKFDESKKSNEPSIFVKIFAIVMICLVGFGLINQLLPKVLEYLPRISFLPDKYYPPTATPLPTKAPGQVFPCPLDSLMKQTIRVEGYLHVPIGEYYPKNDFYPIMLIDTFGDLETTYPGDNPHIIHAKIPNNPKFGLTIGENIVKIRDSQGQIVPWLQETKTGGIYTTRSKVLVAGVVIDTCWIDITSIQQINH